MWEMIRSFLKSKIHGATITGVNRDYDGSITLSKALIDAAGLCVHEKVLVCNLENGARFETYVIEGGDGQVEVNGAAAHLASTGDKVIVMSFCLLDDEELKEHEPLVVKPDTENNP